jgi:hypothetical protein
MATISFEGESHQEIVQQVRRWLETEAADEEGMISPSQAVAQGANVTKDALRIVAAAAPKPIAQNDVVKSLTDMGYKATDATRDAILSGLDNVADITGGGVVSRVTQKGASAVYEMNAAVAKGILKGVTGR